MNTHFNGNGRPPGGKEGTLPDPAAGSRRSEEEKEAAVTQDAQRSLEALSEEIVSTAISTVVQNTLSALLRSTDTSEDPSLAEFLPTETPPSALETSTPPVDTPTHTTVTTLGPLEAEEDVDEEAGGGGGEEVPDDTLVPTEDEDFELLDQSELEHLDEGLGLGSDRQAVGGASETPPSYQHQPQS